ncbi:MAG: hypothetical protein ABSC17_00370 [Thermacetogeniaceae bacterium]
MTVPVPDVEGYVVLEACRILQQAGYQVAVITTGCSRPYRARVLRQRQLNESLIELTQGFEFYEDPSINEKEVTDRALQDY